MLEGEADQRNLAVTRILEDRDAPLPAPVDDCSGNVTGIFGQQKQASYGEVFCREDQIFELSTRRDQNGVTGPGAE